MADVKQKYGRPNEATPAKWNKEYKDFNAPLDNGVIAPTSKQIDMADASKETETAIEREAEVTAGQSEEVVQKATKSEPSNPNDESKKRKRHEGETPEEKAERKRKKKEKKEQREKQKSRKEGSEDSQ